MNDQKPPPLPIERLVDGARLRRMREARDLTHETLAALTSRSYRTRGIARPRPDGSCLVTAAELARIEAGEKVPLSGRAVLYLSTALQSQIDYLLGAPAADEAAPPPTASFTGPVFVCTRGPRGKPRPCEVCGVRAHEKLCDGPGQAPGATCDRRLCRGCATHVRGKDLDYCPDHAPVPVLDPPRDSVPPIAPDARGGASDSSGAPTPASAAPESGASIVALPVRGQAQDAWANFMLWITLAPGPIDRGAHHAIGRDLPGASWSDPDPRTAAALCRSAARWMATLAGAKRPEALYRTLCEAAGSYVR